jgi:hypothetical protein
MMKNLHLLTIKVFVLLSLIFIMQSCKGGNDDYEEDYVTEDGYEDGTYCADVSYYNPNTGTSNSYTLEVEVQGNQVTQINWGNGGWMDEDHFYAQDLDDGGYCSFTSDKGYDYTVQITGQDCGYTDESSFESDVQADEEAVTCPNCGGEKEDYDTYCQSCTSRIEDEEENTCSRCGGFQYYVYGGLCDNCTSQDEEDGY